MRRWMLLACTLVTACGPSSRGGGGNGDRPDAAGDVDAPAPIDASDLPLPDGQQAGCGNLNNCYSVYAHGDHTLYVIDLMAKTLVTVGPFKAPLVKVGSAMKEDVITDLAVAPDNTIYVISETALYIADPHDGHVTQVGSSAACGTKTVALTATPAGKIYAGDFNGSLCEVDVTTHPPTMKPPVTMSGGYALTGDMVAVDDGTVYGTAYKLADAANTGTQINNVLVTVDLTTGAVTPIGGGSGYPKLFGASYALGKVFGFTHDGTGNVVEIDRTSGAGTIYATFTDAATQKGISFAGAGVNALVVVN
jgi:Repeat of unknown function (DUF6923)